MIDCDSNLWFCLFPFLVYIVEHRCYQLSGNEPSNLKLLEFSEGRSKQSFEQVLGIILGIVIIRRYIVRELLIYLPTFSKQLNIIFLIISLIEVVIFRLNISRMNKIDFYCNNQNFIYASADDYILTDGIHQAIVDEIIWEKAQDKRKKQSSKYQKVNQDKNQNIYILSTLIKCPHCGAGLYGNKSIKKKKNIEGEYYQDYLYYSCKHRKMMDGYKCDFKKQIKVSNVNREVLTIIKKLVSTPAFAKKLEQKINVQIDTGEIDKLIEQYNTHCRKLNATKINLITQLDSLDFEDKHYQQKYQDLNMRLDSIYDKLEEVEELIRENESKREVILKEKMTSDNIYKILINFESLLDVMGDIDKKRLCQLLIEKVDIYDEKNEMGRWVKAIHFRLPIIEHDMDISLDNVTQAEAVVKLTKLK